MNRLIFLTLLITLSLTSSAVAQQAGPPAESVVDHVVVFRNGAQVFRAGNASLPAGRSTLRFTGLDPALQAESVQFRIDDDVQVLAVTHQDNFLDRLDDSEAVIRLKNLREQKADSSEIESMFVEVYEREIGLLLANQSKSPIPSHPIRRPSWSISLATRSTRPMSILSPPDISGRPT